MNEYDTELVRSILAKENFTFVKTEEAADIILLNTCAIREHAHRKVYGRIHEIKNNREKIAVKQNPGTPKSQLHAFVTHPKIGILGCMATNLRADLLENRSLEIDFIAGPDSYKRLPDLIRESYNANGKNFDVTLSEFETYSDVHPAQQEGVGPSTPLRVNAWIAVMRGCNNFCTFCVVPYTRGRERSRSPENVVEEVKMLADRGFKQITLLGQNVNSYRHENTDFAQLIEAVSKVNGIERIRFTSPHPKDFPDALLSVIAHNPKVCKSVHMPLQAGNNRILDLMNRTYTKEEFLALLDKTRRIIPNVMITTDVIVGFSSETDAEFEDTMKVMKEAEFDMAFMFKYSERQNTIASKKYPDDVPEAIKTERIVRLNEQQKAICLKRNEAHVGMIEKVLVEEMARGEKVTGFFAARTDGGKLVIVPPANFKIGDMISVKIESATPTLLRGTAIF